MVESKNENKIYLINYYTNSNNVSNLTLTTFIDKEKAYNFVSKYNNIVEEINRLSKFHKEDTIYVEEKIASELENKEIKIVYCIGFDATLESIFLDFNLTYNEEEYNKITELNNYYESRSTVSIQDAINKLNKYCSTMFTVEDVL